MTEAVSYGRLSPRFTEIVCMEGKDIPFHMACDKIKRNFAVEVSADTIRRAVEFIGTQEFEKAGKELSGQDYLACEQSHSPEQICIEIDGSTVNTREESWKECKLGLVYDPKDTKQTGAKGRVTIQAKSLAGALAKGYAEFTLRLKRLLLETGALGAKKHILISDGSLWIEKVFQAIIPNGVMILDWYHACEHLWDCANKIYKNSAQAECWVAFYKQLLIQGRIEHMLERLLKKAETLKKEHQTPIRELYSYFNTRRERVRYEFFIQKGYPIGSGAIESAHKYCVQARLKQAGMRWSIKNANAVIQLRSSYLSGNWDKIWAKAA